MKIHAIWSDRGHEGRNQYLKNPARLDLKVVSDFFLQVLNLFHKQTFSCLACFQLGNMLTLGKKKQKPTASGSQLLPQFQIWATEAPAQSHKRRDHNPPRAMLWPAADAKPTTSPRPCLHLIKSIQGANLTRKKRNSAIQQRKVPARFQQGSDCSCFSGRAFSCHQSPAPEIETQQIRCCE